MLKWNEEINWPILLAGTPLLYILRVNRSQMSFENKVIRLHLFSSSYHAELCFSYCNSSYFVLTIMRTIRYDCCWKNYKYFHKAYVYSTESETTSDIPKTIWIHHHRHRHLSFISVVVVTHRHLIGRKHFHQRTILATVGHPGADEIIEIDLNIYLCIVNCLNTYLYLSLLGRPAST